MIKIAEKTIKADEITSSRGVFAHYIDNTKKSLKLGVAFGYTEDEARDNALLITKSIKFYNDNHK